MTHAEEIVQAVSMIVGDEPTKVFTRDQVRRQLGLSSDDWLNRYTATFQAMRVDQPGGAPSVASHLKGIFKRLSHGQYRLTDYGVSLVLDRPPNIEWREAVLSALRRCSDRHNSRAITRQSLIEEELETIAQQTATEGKTPGQTLSRVLQDLRDDGLLHFTNPGAYVLLDTPVHVESEDLSIKAIDYAIKHEKLILDNVPTSDVQGVARQRRGQQRIRQLTLRNYEKQCAFCDVTDEKFLVASHISRWGDDPETRGILSNVICMCKIHDALFENGFFALADDYSIIKRENVEGKIIRRVLDLTRSFRKPIAHPPAPEYLRKHRRRVRLP